MVSTVVVDIPSELDADKTRQWLQDLVGQRVAVARLRAEIGGQAHPPGPGVVAQIGRLEAAWRDIEGRFGLLTADDLARLSGAAPVSVRTWVHNVRRRQGLLAVRRGGRNLFPGFQFTGMGRPQPWLKPVTAPLLAAGWSEEAVLLWLAAPTGLLSGQTPLEVIDADPQRVHGAVRAATAGPLW